MVVEMAPVMKRLRDAGKTPAEAAKAGILSDAEHAKLDEMNTLIAEVIAVDDFTPEELSRYFKDHSATRAEDYEATPKEAAE
jgi:acyl-CoA dehydrogenase